MTFCGGQRDAPGNFIPRTNLRRDADSFSEAKSRSVGVQCRSYAVAGNGLLCPSPARLLPMRRPFITMGTAAPTGL
jgi:hypothetical protein